MSDINERNVDHDEEGNGSLPSSTPYPPQAPVSQEANEEPLTYSPNRRNPRAAQDKNDDPPIPPAGFGEKNPNGEQIPPLPLGFQQNFQGQIGAQGRFIPNTYQKLIWSGAGFLAGFLGVLVIFFVGFRRPPIIRREMIKWAAIGLAAGYAVDIVLMLITGGSIASGVGSSLFPAINAASTSIF